MTRWLLRKLLRAMSPSSMGLDALSLRDLRSLPDCAMDWLAQLLQLVEDEGQWPGVLAEGYTSLILKTGEQRPLGTRPLTVPVHRLLVVGGDPSAGCLALAGGVGPPASLRLPPLPGPLMGRGSRPSYWSRCGSRGGI